MKNLTLYFKIDKARCSQCCLKHDCLVMKELAICKSCIDNMFYDKMKKITTSSGFFEDNYFDDYNETEPCAK